MTPRVLVSGSTGKVGRRTIAELGARGIDVLAATRSPTEPGQVRFAWDDPATFTALDGLEALLVVAPPGAGDPLGAMRPGLERALASGARRFVLIGASSIAMDGPLTGRVYRWLAEHAPEWIVLRPSWFMQNLSEGQHLPTIRDERAIYSATGDGRVPFIDVDDIARVAARALTDPGADSGEQLLTGPEALTYDDVAARLSEVVGESVKHLRLGEDAMAARFAGVGLPSDFARGLAAMDSAIANGAEDRVSDVVETVTGRTPTPFRAFAGREAAAWRRSAGVSPRH